MALRSKAIRFFFIVSSFLFVAGLFQSCKEKHVVKKNKLNSKELITEVKNLYYNDQKYQRIMGMLEYRCPSDSSSTSTPDLDKKIQLAVNIIYQQQSIADNKNTKKLIELTKKYGFPGMKHLHHDVPVFLVFVHSDKKYFKQIRKLITKGYEAGQVSKFERDYIFWHLNGRKGMTPPIPHAINYRRSVDIFKGALKEDEN